MKLIIGLGNPGKQYESTRHNVGFMAVDQLSDRLNIPLDRTKFNGLYGIGHISGEKVILLKPLTYMNLSGECIRPLMEYYEVDDNEIVVIYDDLDIPTGKIRLRTKGSAGGHNGIKSMIQHLGTQQFNRVRVGIDRPSNGMTITDYVLGRFIEEEQADIQSAIKQSAEACEKWLTADFNQVMNEFN
ncbi:aminoacyl-tRNA hydrolase [Metabacillus fastidiosus]|uniref:Peptidyl-tRNA hydrolase n=1 Tax=Metabacillus fastidiosus TaxID=1458 RepID=A0ABU6P493_9BACI|nr:aminoacyl-tRNA hydrolase [Metabacillus fastidiosus]MED4404165.1 aminoacyl-tRNA hydrolase [Metabacillus fastidiosus]MED4455574.1 aminoacyl-tRNA hydrolase [Metabacillus fastidiosus]MED4464716.1 aminoacyl-tRNA hydrolase [Metabacillus fastidiosus]